MNGLKKASIDIDRKVLADLAVHDKAAFTQDRGAGQSLSGLIESANNEGGATRLPFFWRSTREVRRSPCPPSIRIAMTDLDRIVAAARADFAACADPAALENAKARYLGKAGALTELLKALGKLAAGERPAAGARDQRGQGGARGRARRAPRRARRREARSAARRRRARRVAARPRHAAPATLHPLTRTLERIETLFRSLGFEVADGPEIEDDFHNFTALNTPENHPARSMHDTFYVEGGMVLRTHTSPIQVRYMETHAPPIKIIAPGRVYRVDSDATHSPMFHQVEGLWIDRATSRSPT